MGARLRGYGGVGVGVLTSRAASCPFAAATAPGRRRSGFGTVADRYVAVKRETRRETAPSRPPTSWRSIEEASCCRSSTSMSRLLSHMGQTVPSVGNCCPIRGTAFPIYGTRCPIRGQQVLILFYLLKLRILTACLPLRLTLISP